MKKLLKRIVELLEEISNKLGDVQQQSQPGGPGQPEPPDEDDDNG